MRKLLLTLITAVVLLHSAIVGAQNYNINVTDLPMQTMLLHPTHWSGSHFDVAYTSSTSVTASNVDGGFHLHRL